MSSKLLGKSLIPFKGDWRAMCLHMPHCKSIRIRSRSGLSCMKLTHVLRNVEKHGFLLQKKMSEMTLWPKTCANVQVLMSMSGKANERTSYSAVYQKRRMAIPRSLPPRFPCSLKNTFLCQTL